MIVTSLPSCSESGASTERLVDSHELYGQTHSIRKFTDWVAHFDQGNASRLGSG